LPIATRAATQDLYRLLVLRQGGSELLVAGKGAPFTLPWVEIPGWERVAENVVSALRKRYGISSICLFPPEVSTSSTDCEQPLYQVVETREAIAAPAGMRWLRLNSLLQHCFVDERDSGVVAGMQRQIAEFQSGVAIGPFAIPGWIEALFSWVQPRIEPYGLRLSGEFRQLNASPKFALLRLETDKQAVWFKAVGEPNLREFPISVALARHFPAFVPTMIATHPGWHGWLTTECAGRTLDEVGDACAWERAAQSLAELQINSVGTTEQLLEAGCRDVRLTSLLKVVDPFVDAMLRLMERQPRTPPPILRPAQLQTLGRHIKDALSHLDELAIPETLGHLDFNPGNILCSPEQCIFLDWAEAYVGPPFLTLQYLLEHQAQMAGCRRPDPQRLVERYASQWGDRVSSSAVAAALRVTPLLAVFACAQASDWAGALSGEERLGGYLRSLTRRMQHESARFDDAKRTPSGSCSTSSPCRSGSLQEWRQCPTRS
jgi:hypothetical protein